MSVSLHDNKKAFNSTNYRKKNLRPLRIHIGVGGRFHADQMAKAFLDAGHQVTVFSSYPHSRFPGLARKAVKSFLLPELLYRGLRRIGMERQGEQLKMVTFGRWLKRKFAQSGPDVSFIWSSFADETFHSPAGFKVVVRDSTHILHQCAVLAEQTEDKDFISNGLTKVMLSRERGFSH